MILSYYLYMSYAFAHRALLTVLGQKYDQYLDFAQQDAHEFLRILLDAMRMEEQDVSFPPFSFRSLFREFPIVLCFFGSVLIIFLVLITSQML